MTVEGADVAQLRSAAAQFSKGASALEASAKALHSLIGSATRWRGPDADRFRSQWSGQSARTINAAVDALRQASKTLQRNADEQDKASAVHVGDAVATSVYQGSAAPNGTAQLFDSLNKDNDHNKGDGFHIDKVVGPDGKTRLIVYFEGTFEADRLTVARNGDVIKGLVDPYLTKQIDEALRQTPDGMKSDVMLVGFSQGGMDAQNIAASGRYHVTDLVTYGSPLVQPDNPGIATVHLQAKGDNVPNLGLAGIGADGVVDMVQHGDLIGGAQAVGDAVNYVGRTSTPSNWIFESDPHIAPPELSNIGADVQWAAIGNHGVPAYQAVAADFDKSTDPHYDAVKQSMQKFDGPVLPAT
jgi:hypothetical protein